MRYNFAVGRQRHWKIRLECLAYLQGGMGIGGVAAYALMAAEGDLERLEVGDRRW